MITFLEGALQVKTMPGHRSTNLSPLNLASVHDSEYVLFSNVCSCICLPVLRLRLHTNRIRVFSSVQYTVHGVHSIQTVYTLCTHTYTVGVLAAIQELSLALCPLYASIPSPGPLVCRRA
jgi:hypothetical protein